ncbi:MAG: ArsR/SmtB family transcription factor [Bdellovibrionota bacterium]
MEIFEVCEALASLAQETRLRVFKLLIQYGRDGAAPGTLAAELKIPDNTLSFHLSHLNKAGLINSTKSGRTITYFANIDAMTKLIDYLQESCCAREASKKSKTKKCGDRNC